MKTFLGIYGLMIQLTVFSAVETVAQDAPLSSDYPSTFQTTIPLEWISAPSAAPVGSDSVATASNKDDTKVKSADAAAPAVKSPDAAPVPGNNSPDNADVAQDTSSLASDRPSQLSSIVPKEWFSAPSAAPVTQSGSDSVATTSTDTSSDAASSSTSEEAIPLDAAAAPTAVPSDYASDVPALTVLDAPSPVAVTLQPSSVSSALPTVVLNAQNNQQQKKAAVADKPRRLRQKRSL